MCRGVSKARPLRQSIQSTHMTAAKLTTFAYVPLNVLIACDRVANGDAPSAAPPTPTASAPAVLLTVDKEAMKADPKFSKYFKMVAVSTPHSVINQAHSSCAEL